MRPLMQSLLTIIVVFNRMRYDSYMTIRRQNNRSGFTIVELAIVIAVIAILAVMTTVGYGAVRDRARDASITTEITRVSQELAAYNIANQNKYPTTLAEIGVTASDGVAFAYTPTSDRKGYQLVGSKDGASFRLRDTDQAPQKL